MFVIPNNHKVRCPNLDPKPKTNPIALTLTKPYPNPVNLIL